MPTGIIQRQRQRSSLAHITHSKSNPSKEHDSTFEETMCPQNCRIDRVINDLQDIVHQFQQKKVELNNESFLDAVNKMLHGIKYHGKAIQASMKEKQLQERIQEFCSIKKRMLEIESLIQQKKQTARIVIQRIENGHELKPQLQHLKRILDSIFSEGNSYFDEDSRQDFYLNESMASRISSRVLNRSNIYVEKSEDQIESSPISSSIQRELDMVKQQCFRLDNSLKDVLKLKRQEEQRMKKQLQKLQERISNSQKKNKEREYELLRYVEENIKIKNNIGTLQQQKEHLDELVKEVQRSNGSERKKKQRLLVEIQQMKVLLENQTCQKKTLVQQHRHQINTLKQQIEGLQQEKQKTVQVLKKQQQQHNKRTAKRFNCQITSMKQRINSLIQQNQDKQHTINNYKQKIGQLQNEKGQKVRILKQELKNIRSQRSRIEAAHYEQLKLLQQNGLAQRMKLVQLYQNQKRQNHLEIEALNKEFQVMNDYLYSVESQSKQLCSQKQSMQREIYQLKQQIKSILKKSQNYQKDIKALQENLATLQRKYVEARQIHEQEDATKTRLKGQLSALKSQNRGLQDKNIQLEAIINNK